MYPPKDTDSSELTEARVEIQQFLGTWLSLPWLIKEYTSAYAKHLLFFISLILFAFKARNSRDEQIEFDERVRQAFAETRRRYRSRPDEIIGSTFPSPDDETS